MTALAGYWSFAGDAATAQVRTMLTAQAIYGKHDAHAVLGPVALGRRLWPLLPEDAFDTGPLTLRDGTALLIADARIDNRDEIAAQLGLGAELSDAAMVGAAIEHWGVDAIPRLIGAFALALWDDRAGTLTLARDALGERPLHYHRGDTFVAVASMPKGLHACPGVPYGADIATSADFLALLPETGSNSFFAGIERVVPGEIVTIARDGTTRRSFWSPDLSSLNLESDAAYAEAVRAALDRAVGCRLRRASGGVGAQLSAGLDSSAVATSAALQIAPEQLTAFTHVPAGPVVRSRNRIEDEGDLAALTAAMPPAMEHVRIRSDAAPTLPMDRQFQLYERPVLNPSNATWAEAINDAAQARGISVLLTGGMGNMTFSHDGAQHLPGLLRRGRWIALARLSRRAMQNGATWRELAGVALGPVLPRALWLWQTARRGNAMPLSRYTALRADTFAALGVGERAAARGLDLDYRPWIDSRAMRLWGLRRVDMGVYIKGTLAGWGIDLRDPTADRRLVELTLRVPEAQFILNGVPRSLARRAFADRLPPEVRDERRRGLQGADWPTGLAAARATIAAELDAFERCAEASQVIDVPRLRAALADWPEGRWGEEDVTLFYRHAMQRAVAAGHFLRKVARTN